jgi:hypothetical protein
MLSVAIGGAGGDWGEETGGNPAGLFEDGMTGAGEGESCPKIGAATVSAPATIHMFIRRSPAFPVEDLPRRRTG